MEQHWGGKSYPLIGQARHVAEENVGDYYRMIGWKLKLGLKVRNESGRKLESIKLVKL